MQYLAWRVLAGLHKSITISFLIVGHTKFAPDWAFGLLKQRFRKTRVDCLDDLVRVVEGSAEVNHAQLVATQAGEVMVPTYDWAGFFEVPFKQTALRGIKSYHHFKFDAVHPGVVEVLEGADEMSKKLNLLTDPTWRPPSHDLPPIIKPAGLSDERVAYLHDKIREFCREEVQDLVCPAPMGTITQPLPPASQPEPTQPIQPPPAKKQRLCSECKEPGHNKRTCPKLSLAAATPLAD